MTTTKLVAIITSPALPPIWMNSLVIISTISLTWKSINEIRKRTTKNMTNYSLEVNFSQIYTQLLTGTKKREHITHLSSLYWLTATFRI